MKNLPLEFQERMKKILGDEYEDFIKAYDEKPQRAFRVNTDKISLEDFEKLNIFSTEKITAFSKSRRTPGLRLKIFLFFRYMLLTIRPLFAIFVYAPVSEIYGGVAQLARAFGSYPKCHRFESSRRYQTPESIERCFLAYMARWSSG